MKKHQILILISLAIMLTSCYHYELGQRDILYRNGKTYPITEWTRVDSSNLANGTIIHELKQVRFKDK